MNALKLRVLGWALTLLLVMLQISCGSPRRGEPLIGPLELTDPAQQRGQVAFMRHCHSCHPSGEGGLGPGINDKPLPRFLIATQVRAGLGSMPRFTTADLPPEELDEIISYLVAVRRAASTGRAVSR
jgi:mono/diheme cytochrome c family protein